MKLSSNNVPYPTFFELDDIHVMGATFHETENDVLLFQATIQADINISGKGKYDFETDMVEGWFSLKFSGLLSNGTLVAKILDVGIYSKDRFRAEDALTKFLVPYVYAKDLDVHAEKFLLKYYPSALEHPIALPVQEIASIMGLKVYIAPLSEGIFGKTFFSNANTPVYDNNRNVVHANVTSGTILVNPDVFFMHNIGTLNNTIIHECVHWDKHRRFFKLQELLNSDYNAISCAVVENYSKESTGIVKALDWMEWQANALAPKILMPAKTTREKLHEILKLLYGAFPETRSGVLMELAIRDLSDFFQVSIISAKLRAIELGFEQAAGVHNYIDGQYYPPFSFKKGTLKKDQTFIVDLNNAIFESAMNPGLSDIVRAGNFIHANGLFVINDPKYVSFNDNGKPSLSDYALEHVDECCLIFSRQTRVRKEYDDSFYRMCFLCRDADSKSFIEASCDIHAEHNEDVVKRSAEMQKIKAEADRIQEIHAGLPSSFAGTLNAHILRKNYTNEDMEERTRISEKTIRDYRKNHEAKPDLSSVLALCIGLNLQPLLAFDLISKAGHNIFNVSPANLVFLYLISNHHMENIDMWNEKLADANIPQQLPRNKK